MGAIEFNIQYNAKEIRILIIVSSAQLFDFGLLSFSSPE
jgi:hypothetical protein